MTPRTAQLTKHLKVFDRLLYAEQGHSGQHAIFRKSKRYEHFEFEGQTLFYERSSPHLIFALTDTWAPGGRPVDWGIEPILNRLKAMDMWADETVYDRFMKQEEKEKESKDKYLKNSIEDFLKDFRRQFARATNDVNTSSLSKTDKRRFSHGRSK